MSGRSSVVESLLPKQVVAGSNPAARSKPPLNIPVRFESATGDSERGVPLSWGACEGAGPLCRSREASFRADPATERGSNPAARSIPHFV